MKPMKLGNRPPNYFKKQIQKNNSEWINKVNWARFSRDAEQIWRDISRGNIDVGEVAYFDHPQFFTSLYTASEQMRFKLFHMQGAMRDYINANGFQGNPNIVSIGDEVLAKYSAYGVIIETLDMYVTLYNTQPENINERYFLICNTLPARLRVYKEII